MKKSLPRRSMHKREELNTIVNIIKSVVDIEMVILFGSYARGDWVNDIYIDPDDNNTYEYKSDMDILAVTATNSQANSLKIWDRVNTLIKRNEDIEDVISIIVHDIEDLNRKIEKGEYFFVDIKNEGVMLYDKCNYKLARTRKLSPKERKETAKEDFEYCFEKIKDFLIAYNAVYTSNGLKIAAFLLHQIAECLYVAILLVFTQYRPKTHDLETLHERAGTFDPRFLTIFPRRTKREKRLFNLLKRAYVEARYKRSYRITREELEYLFVRVEKLKNITETVCVDKIASIG